MADNTVIDDMAGGDVIATDDIGGVKFPRSKITLGADGVNNGDVSAANPLPCTLAGGSVSATLSGGSVNATIANSVTVGSLPALAAGSNAIGKINFNALTGATLTSASINASSSGNNTLIAGTSSQTIKVYRLFVVVDKACTLTIKDGSSTALTGALTFTKGGALVLDLDGEPWFTTASGNDFVVNLSAAVQISGRIYYLKG